MDFSATVAKGIGSITNASSDNPTRSDIHLTAGSVLFSDGLANTSTSGQMLTNAGVEALTPIDSTEQYWRPSYVVDLLLPGGGGVSQLDADVLHEVLHNIGFRDSQIQTGLGLPTTTDTTNISTWLHDNCIH